ncbi:MAG TPA: anhydro-N-acetylmuramic acid kinase [Nitrospinota bacterium]|nr:anhydro-N-acetylmuramic acid kinase [Nitrospinota bacterium]
MPVYLGAMSGTSLDGIDVAAYKVTSKSCTPKIKFMASVQFPYSNKLRSRILNFIDGNGGAEEASTLDTYIAQAYCKAVKKLLKTSELKGVQVEAMGMHGQTVWHKPEIGHTLQLGNAALLSQNLVIDVWHDFRSADIAAGGQGAPLAPIVHHLLFTDKRKNVSVINLGGIANLTYIPKGAQCLSDLMAYDTGPGVMLIDMAAMAMGIGAFDKNGRESANHEIDPTLLSRLLSHPYFKKKPPKSTGREEFGKAFIKWSKTSSNRLSKGTTLATFTKLTSTTIANEIRRLKKQGKKTDRLVVCGGGANNCRLVSLLGETLPTVEVVTSDTFGIGTRNVETALMALLTWCATRRKSLDLLTITGSKSPVMLGKLSPAYKT